MKYTSINNVLVDKLSGEWGVEPEGDSGIKIIRTANFTNLGIIDFSNIVLRKIEPKKVEQKKLISGDVIIEKSGGSPTQPVGRVVFFENPDNSIYLCNNFTTILRPNKNKVFPKYLFYTLFYNHLTKKTLRFQNKTTGIINLKLENYLKSDIPLPPLEDQIRIAAVLTRAEALIAKRKESIKALDELLKSTFLEMFGDPVRNTKGWDVVSIKALCSKVIDCPHNTPIYSEVLTGLYCIRSSDIQNGYVDLNSTLQVDVDTFNKRNARYVPSYNDIIFTREGGRLGNCARVPEDVNICLGQRIMLFTVDRKIATSEFLWASLITSSLQQSIKNLAAGGAAPRVNIKDLIKMKCYQPPLPLQEKFTTIVRQVEVLKAKYTQSLIGLENLYGSLTQRAFKGELDLSKVPFETENKIMDLNEEKRGISSVDSKLNDSNIYSEAELLKVIQSMSGETFTFDFLMVELKKSSFEQMPEYGKLKEQIYKMLEGTNPLLLQNFDKINKEIVLRVNI